MAHRIELEDLIESEGFVSLEDLLADASNRNSCPALCSDGCETEPDSHCEHGHPSAMLAAGVI